MFFFLVISNVDKKRKNDIIRTQEKGGVSMALPCNNLNLNLYRVFYTVAKTKSFSESSRTLHISQPAISKHIQNLEYELNTLLFYRTNRGIELTPEAKELLIYIEKAWNFIMLGEKHLVESKDLAKGKISIGVPTYISVYFLNNLVKKFRKEHPNIIIKMANESREKMLELFHQYTLDMLIISGSIDVTKEQKIIPLYKENYCFVCKKEQKENLAVNTLNELVEKPLLLPVKTTETRKKLEEVFTTEGLTADPIMELGTNEMILNYVREGLGIGYILETIAKQQEDLEILKLDKELPEEEIFLIYNETTLPPAGKEFLNLIETKE